MGAAGLRQGVRLCPFSAVHMMSALWAEPNDDSSSIGILVSKIAATDHDLPEHIYIEAFYAATDILLKYVEGWAFRRQTHSSLHGCVVSVKEPTCDKQFGYTSHHAVPEPARRGAG
jgi:hypothetical protein